MPSHDIIVIGASAGGIQPLLQLVSELPPHFPAAIFIVVHIPTDYPSVLPAILSRNSNLPAVHASDGQAIHHGCIYVAPPDNHILLVDGVIRLYHGPKENYARPAIDPLFRSAAETYGERTVGVILSGMLYDGTAGLITIKGHGGIAIVQDPGEARYASMPMSAIRQDHPDYILPLSEIGAMLVRLSHDVSELKQGETCDRFK